MAQVKICTTSSEGLRPLGQDGQRSYEMITALVGSRLGPEHASLFSEPVPAKGGAETDWYCTGEGNVRGLRDLSEVDQERARTRLSELTADISELADQLTASGGGNNARLAEALRNALEVPDESAVHVIAGSDGGLQPVLVTWANAREGGELYRGILSGLAPKRPAPPPAETATLDPKQEGQDVAGLAVAPAVFVPWWLAWLLWVILALILVAILLLLVSPCGVRGFFGPSFCPLVSTPRLEHVLAERAALETRVRDLERAIADSEAACKPTLGPEPELLEQRGANEIDRRLDAAQAQRGDMNVALAWDTLSDVDLAVTCPNGVKINFKNRNPQNCNGSLDVDANVARTALTRTPIENIFFADPQVGTYQIEVNLFKNRAGQGRQPFDVQLRIGDDTQHHSGWVSRSNPTWSTTFDYRSGQ